MRSDCDEQLEEGFTLLELIVVMSVIAVLIAVAVPSFLSARNTVQERAAQADLRTALEAANTVYVDAQTFQNVTLDALTAAEPRISWHDTRTTGPGTLAVLTDAVVAETGVPAIGIAVQAGDGTCFYAYQTDNDAPWYGHAPSSGGCDATQAALVATARSF